MKKILDWLANVIVVTLFGSIVVLIFVAGVQVFGWGLIPVLLGSFTVMWAIGRVMENWGIG